MNRIARFLGLDSLSKDVSTVKGRMEALDQAIDQYANFVKLSKEDKGKLKRQVIELVQNTRSLSAKDIQAWRNAHQYAISVEQPYRKALYDIYYDSELDCHLTGCISQRKGMVLQKAFRLIGPDGQENEEATRILERGWFKDFESYALDSIYWGHSLIELGEVISDEKGLRYSEVSLVPREHVVPEFGIVLRDINDDYSSGMDYLSGPLSVFTVSAGRKDDLGLLLKVSPHCISKRHQGAFWDQFAELFGMPFRIATTVTQNEEDRKKIEDMMINIGTAAWGVFPEGTMVDFKETSRTDAYNVYNKKIDRCNSEISKCILAQTMTIDDGSSRSQSQVHLEVFKNLVSSDADFLRDLVNDSLLPKMVAHGFPVGGLRFDWDEGVDYTPDQMRNVEQMILNQYEVDPQYFIDRYNIPITGKKTQEEPQLSENSFFV